MERKFHKTSLKDFFITLFFNTLIAGFLYIINFGKSFIINLIFSQCIGITIFLCVNVILYFFKSDKHFINLILVIIAIITGAFIGIYSGSFINNIEIYKAFDLESIIQTFIFSSLFGSVIAYFFYSREKITEVREEILEEKLRNITNEKTIIESELRLLQAQIEPHFQFNTLSTILSLIDDDPEKSKKMMEDFIKLLRVFTSNTIEKTSSIKNEIEIIKSYLSICKIRMGNRLNYEISIEDKILDCQIPSLSIQTLIENSVKHGLEPKMDGGIILIYGKMFDNKILFEISDNGVGIDPNNLSKGTGLSNVKKRLELLYGSQSRFILEENHPSGVKIILEVPYETYKSNHS